MRKIVTLCGPSRYGEAYEKALYEETRKGHMVFTLGTMRYSDAELLQKGIATPKDLEEMAAVHRDKILISQEIVVLNVDDYIGEATLEEVKIARICGIKVRWLVYPSRHAQMGESDA